MTRRKIPSSAKHFQDLLLGQFFTNLRDGKIYMKVEMGPIALSTAGNAVELFTGKVAQFHSTSPIHLASDFKVQYTTSCSE